MLFVVRVWFLRGVLGRLFKVVEVVGHGFVDGHQVIVSFPPRGAHAGEVRYVRPRFVHFHPCRVVSAFARFLYHFVYGDSDGGVLQPCSLLRRVDGTTNWHFDFAQANAYRGRRKSFGLFGDLALSFIWDVGVARPGTPCGEGARV